MVACKRSVKIDGDYCMKHKGFCMIPGCHEHIRTKGMCNTHYINAYRKRIRANNDDFCVYPDCFELKESEELCEEHLKTKRELGEPRKCAVPSCKKWAAIDKHCEEHYHIFNFTGSPVKSVNLCGIPECEELHVLKGMCQKHYAQWKRDFERD
jgi:hypothetical protein